MNRDHWGVALHLIVMACAIGVAATTLIQFRRAPDPDTKLRIVFSFAYLWPLMVAYVWKK